MPADDKTSHHILVIDDDTRLRDLIGRFLIEQDFRVTLASSAEEAQERIKGIRFDLMVVDIMLDGMSGLDFVRKYKEEHQTPCLMLTAMGKPGERLHGLESGADDYMTKPFEPLELVLRIKNILARQNDDAETQSLNMMDKENTVSFGPHCFDLTSKQLITAGKKQYITTSESKLLHCFCEASGQVLTREYISDRLNGQMVGRSIDVAVARLRRKLEPNPSKPIYLLTTRGYGWVLEADRR